MEHLFVVISHSSRSLSEIHGAFNGTDGDIVAVRLYFALLFLLIAERLPPRSLLTQNSMRRVAKAVLPASHNLSFEFWTTLEVDNAAIRLRLAKQSRQTVTGEI
jgi:hypothetical protein